MSGRTSQEISDLEGELLAMRNLLSSQAALVRSLAESGAPNSASNTSKVDTQDKNLPQNDPEPTEVERLAQALPDIIDVLLAQKKVDQALSALDDGDRLVAEGLNSNSYEGRISRDVASDLQQLSPKGDLGRPRSLQMHFNNLSFKEKN